MTIPYWSDCVPNSTFYRILSGFHRTFATGVACRQGTLTPPDTWSRPFGTCICSTCWDQSFSELVVILPDYALRISLGTFSILLYSGSFIVDKGIILNNMKCPSRVKYHSETRLNSVIFSPMKPYNNFMTFIPNLTLTYWHEVSMEHLGRVWHASNKGTLTLPGTWSRFFCGLVLIIMLLLFRPVFRTCCNFPDFSLRIFIDTFSILQWRKIN